jgi:diguanylate cyclase (GGDEF)-like protein
LVAGNPVRDTHPHWELRARVRLIVLIGCGCAAAWIAATAYVGVWRLDLMVDRQVGAAHAEAVTVAEVGARAIDRRLDALRTIPSLLAGQERLGFTLANFDLMAAMVPRNLWDRLLWRDEMLRLSRELAVTASNLNLEGIYLVTDDGYVLASSDGESPAGHLGASFSGQDYFFEAMETGQAERFGVDPVTRDPMFFFAHRVERGASHTGVVIVATSSARMLLSIERGPETVYLSDRLGVVVVSSDASLLFRTLSGAQPQGMEEDALMLRYGRSRFEPVEEEVTEVMDRASLLAQGAVHADAVLQQERVTVHIVAPIAGLEAARRDNLNATVGLGLLGVMLTAVVTLALIQIATMRERATRDPLTGLSNRRHADDVLPSLLELDDRGRLAGLTVVSFDLDRFKHINDTWGHAVGDRVLRRFAQIMMRSARRADLVFRYGGEEFLAILVEQDIEGARHYAERVREATEAINDLDPVPPHGITVSAGAVMRARGEPLHEVIARADILLYRAKENGRNRVEVEPA